MGAYPSTQNQWAAGYGVQTQAWPQAAPTQPQQWNVGYTQQVCSSTSLECNIIFLLFFLILFPLGPHRLHMVVMERITRIHKHPHPYLKVPRMELILLLIHNR